MGPSLPSSPCLMIGSRARAWDPRALAARVYRKQLEATWKQLARSSGVSGAAAAPDIMQLQASTWSTLVYLGIWKYMRSSVVPKLLGPHTQDIEEVLVGGRMEEVRKKTCK